MEKHNNNIGLNNNILTKKSKIRKTNQSKIRKTNQSKNNKKNYKLKKTKICRVVLFYSDSSCDESL